MEELKIVGLRKLLEDVDVRRRKWEVEKQSGSNKQNHEVRNRRMKRHQMKPKHTRRQFPTTHSAVQLGRS